MEPCGFLPVAMAWEESEGDVRYAADRKEKTRDRILGAAGRVFRRQGYHASGVDAVMAEAGLTAGGFYAHFDSKQALLAEASSIRRRSWASTRPARPGICQDASGSKPSWVAISIWSTAEGSRTGVRLRPWSRRSHGRTSR